LIQQIQHKLANTLNPEQAEEQNANDSDMRRANVKQAYSQGQEGWDQPLAIRIGCCINKS